jgi:hypothetical protein
MSANQTLPQEPRIGWALEIYNLPPPRQQQQQETGGINAAAAAGARLYLQIRESGRTRNSADDWIRKSMYAQPCLTALKQIHGAVLESCCMSAQQRQPEPMWHFPIDQHEVVARALETTTKLPVICRPAPSLVAAFARPQRPLMTDQGLIKMLALGCSCCIGRIHVDPPQQHQQDTAAINVTQNDMINVTQNDMDRAARLINEQLFPYQREGVRTAQRFQFRTLIADEMGLGKTRQAIACAAAVRRHCWPVVVVCPASLCTNWMVEFMSVMPHQWIVPPPTTNNNTAGTHQPNNSSSSNDANLDEEHVKSYISIVSSKKFHIPAQCRILIVSYSMLEAIGPQLLQNDEQAAESAIAAAASNPKKRKAMNQQQATTMGSSSSRFGTIILDESHYIKNTDSARSKAAVRLCQSMRCRILLSGTPMSRPRELYPQIAAIDSTLFPHGFWPEPRDRRAPDPWSPQHCFYGMRYCDPKRQRVIGQRYVWKWDGGQRLPELYALIQRLLMVRRQKRDVLKDLPPKNRQRVIVEALTGKELAKFTVAREQAKALLEEKGSLPGNPAFMELWRQTAIKKIPSILKYLVEVVCQELQDNPQLKVIVFGHHKAMMDAMTESMRAGSVVRVAGDALVGGRPISAATTTTTTTTPPTTTTTEEEEKDNEEAPPQQQQQQQQQQKQKQNALVLEKTHGAGINCIRIDGSTPRDSRQAMVDLFQTQADVRCAVLSIQAASTGLTLTKASCVYITEMMFGPECMFQAEDRAHRIGQELPVDIKYLMLNGSMDDSVWDMIVGKTRTIGQALNNRTEHLHAPTSHAPNFSTTAAEEAEAADGMDDADEHVMDTVEFLSDAEIARAIAATTTATTTTAAAAAAPPPAHQLLESELQSRITRYFQPIQSSHTTF